MYIEAIILGIIIGYLRGGNLEHLGEKKIRGWWLTPIALIFYLIPYISKFIAFEFEKMQLFPFSTMVIIMLVLFLNYRYIGAIFLGIGTLFNIFIMAISDFKMPIDTAQMSHIGFASFVEGIGQGDILNYVPLVGSKQISLYLGKVISLPDFYPIKQLLSAGDIIASVGLVILISQMMQYESIYSYSSKRRFF